MDIKLKVGNRIKILRKKLELSQERLANEAQLDRTYITDVENGRRNISIEVLLKIVQALKISMSDFFNDKLFK